MSESTYETTVMQTCKDYSAAIGVECIGYCCEGCALDVAYKIPLAPIHIDGRTYRPCCHHRYDSSLYRASSHPETRT